MNRDIADWLVGLSDPAGPGRRLPGAAPDPKQFAILCNQAEAHGVLALVLANGADRFEAPQLDELRQSALSRRTSMYGFSVMLRQRARALMSFRGLAKLRATIIKGMTFADRIYPDRALRRFTDIDVLIDPDDLDEAERALSRLGYVLANARPPGPLGKSTCRNWVDAARGDVVVDLQVDLVHSSSVQRGVSLGYRELAGGDPTRPAALLLIALMHAAMHQFERLIQLVDVLQAARALDDEADFAALVDRCGAHLVAVSGLTLAGDVFAEPRCHALAARFEAIRNRRLAHWLIPPGLAVSDIERPAIATILRRRLYRELLKQPALAAD